MYANWEYAVVYCGLFLGLFAFGLLINAILLRFIKTLGTKNQPGASSRWSSTTKPAIGGLSFYMIFLVVMVFAFMVYDPSKILDRMDLVGVFTAASLGFVMGLTDDAYNTNPVLKFSVQIICGLMFVVTGSEVNLFAEPWANHIVTVLWVVGIMNSINMLDNMDGIASVVSVFILLTALTYFLYLGKHLEFDFMIIVGLVAAILAFLVYNWHPSRMYMGDTGSQFLGVLLAYVGIRYCWNFQTAGGESDFLLSAAALLAVFTLPLTDTAIVSINRIRQGRSPFVGGKDHTTHQLSYLGLSDSAVARVFLLLSAVSLCMYLALFYIAESGSREWLLAYPIYSTVLFLVFFRISQYNKLRGKP